MEHLLLRAIAGQPIERPPVWAMRQAGRWDPEFRKLREGLSFFEFSEDVPRAAKASLLPRRFGVDAIILFYDITTLPFAMGLPFTLQPNRGPVPDQPIQSIADVMRLNPEPPRSAFRHIVELLKRVKDELSGDLPVIVFAGAPFTVASYCIATGKRINATRQFIRREAKAWEELVRRLTTATIHFLNCLAEDGADVYQLFDSWAGELDAAEYERWAHLPHREIFAAAKAVPRILFVKECPYLELMAEAGADVVSLGRRHDLADARRRYPHLAFQGNVDQTLLKHGSPEAIREAVRECIEQGGGQRHIVNLNHGVDKDTPVENFAAFVDAVRGYTR